MERLWHDQLRSLIYGILWHDPLKKAIYGITVVSSVEKVDVW